VYIFM